MAKSAAEKQFQCCFCGARIEPLSPDPVHLVIPLEDSASQELFAHAACLRRTLHSSVALHPDLWEEE
jgi:hypothetical protein